VNPDERTLQPEYLPFLGKTPIPVSAFYFFAGRAAHAVQDSFTHTFRRMDDPMPGHQITSVFNWLSQVRGDLVESVKRPRARNDPRRLRGRQPEQRRSTGVGDGRDQRELLAALTDAGDARRAADAARTRFSPTWMTYEAGCSIDNAYCDNPVHASLPPRIDTHGGARWRDGSRGSGRRPARIAGRPRRAERRGARRRTRAAALLAFAMRGAVATAARARMKTPTVAGARRRARRCRCRTRLRVRLARGGLRLAARRAGRLRRAQPLVRREPRDDGAWAPTNFGVFTHYLHAIRPDVRLRVGVGLGLSILNQDLPGTSAGNVGIYANVRLLGIVWYFANARR
jgi:hypothetical protein